MIQSRTVQWEYEDEDGRRYIVEAAYYPPERPTWGYAGGDPGHSGYFEIERYRLENGKKISDYPEDQPTLDWLKKEAERRLCEADEAAYESWLSLRSDNY